MSKNSHTILFFKLSACIFMLSACGDKAVPSQISLTEKSSEEIIEQPASENSSASLSDDDIVCEAIKNFLLGKPAAAVMSEQAKADLTESSWPEVYCSIEGVLDSPRFFKSLTVKQVAPGKYKYECICPDHGDKFVDFCTIEARITGDGKTVVIERIKWDAAEPHS